MRRFVPVAAASLLLVPSIVWVFLDRGIWPWDPSWYGEVSVDLWAGLRTDVGTWETAMTHAFGAKPPAIAWFGQFFVPLSSVVGGDATALLLSVSVCEVGVVALVFAACRNWASRTTRQAWGRSPVAASPLFVLMGHSYFAEPIQTFAIAWGLYVLAAAPRWPIALTAVQIPGVAAFAMLAKLSSPVYLALPLAAAVLLAIRGSAGRRVSRTRSAWRDWRVITSAVLSAALLEGAAAWYRLNLHSAIAHARLASANTGLYGFNRGFFTELPVWIRNFRDVSFLPRVDSAMAVVLVAAIALLVWRRGVRPTLDPRLVVSIACAGTVALVIVLFATQANQQTQYLLGLIPCLGLLSPSSSTRRVPDFSRLPHSRCWPSSSGSFSCRASGRPRSSQCRFRRWLRPPPRRRSHRSSTRSSRKRATRRQPGRSTWSGPTIRGSTRTRSRCWPPSATRRDGRLCYYTALGYANQNPNVAWTRVKQFNSPYYISIDYGDRSNQLPEPERSLIIPSDPFNAINPPSTDW